MVAARDGAKVPVSVVYRKGFERDGSGKLFLYGYGSYGLAIPPTFNTNRISLLDRGWACAIAHVRGGDDLGYSGSSTASSTSESTRSTTSSMCAKGLIAAGFTKRGQHRDQRPIGRRRVGRRGREYQTPNCGAPRSLMCRSSM